MANRGRPPKIKPEDYKIEVIFETPIEKISEKLTIELYNIYEQHKMQEAKNEFEEIEKGIDGF